MSNDGAQAASSQAQEVGGGTKHGTILVLTHVLKSVRVHFVPGSNGRSFPLDIEIPFKMHGCGSRYAPNRGNDV